MLKVGSEVISKGRGAFALGLVGAALALTPARAEAGAVPARTGAPKSSAPRTAVGFIENKGQWPGAARYMGRGQGVTMWLEKGGVLLDYPRPKSSRSKYAGHAVEMRFAGSKGGHLAGASRNGTAQYLTAHKSAVGGKYGKVVNSEIYPGIDFVSYFDGESPRYDFVVAPGANPAAIRLGFNGAKKVRIVDADTLAIGTIFGEQKIDGLFAYQNIEGKRKPISVRFAKNGNGEVKFDLGAYDKSKPLVIDPLVYGTYFGANRGFDEVRAMSSDLTGGTYVAGYTVSTEFPRNQGPYGFDIKGGRDAFLSKLQGDAYANDYSVYIGGSGDDQADFMNVDASGNVFVCGVTDSTDFPGVGVAGLGTGRRWIMRFAPISDTVLTPFRDLNGDNKITVNSNEDAVSNSVVHFFGNDTNGDDAISFLAGFGIPKTEGAAASNTTRIVTGGTSNGNQIADVDAINNGGLGNGSSSAAFYVEYDYNKTTATFTTNQANSGYVVSRGVGISLTGVAVDNKGYTYLNGAITSTTSSNTATDPTPRFDTTAGVYADGRLQRQSDLYVRKLNPNGTVAYSTLLGGSANENAYGTLATRNLDLNTLDFVVDHRGPTIAADDNGNAYIVGGTVSIDYPRTRGVFGPEFNVSRESVALTKISATGNAILYSTNLGIGGIWSVAGVAVDPRGNAYVTGIINSTNTFNATVADPPTPNAAPDIIGSVPTTADAERPTYDYPANPQLSTQDGFFLAINSDATGLLHGTYIGGTLDDATFAPYTDSFGDVFVYGWTDTHREYYLQDSMHASPPTRYLTTANMAPFITAGAFKATPENNNNGLFVIEDNVLYGLTEGPTSTAPVGAGAVTDVPYITNNDPFFSFSDYFAIGGIAYLRDGYVLRYRLGLPLIDSLTVNPTSIPGGDASGSGVPASTTATLTLSDVAPPGGASIVLTVDNPAVASFNPSSSVSSTTITIAPGETTATFKVYSSPVLDVQNVNIRADYAGNVKVAALSVKPWLQALSLSTTTTIGGSGDAGPPSTFATGTVRLEAPAMGNTTVSLKTNDPVVRFVNATGQLLVTGSVIVPNGQQTATFSFQTLGTDTVRSVRIDATLLNVTRSQNITVNPARLNRIEFNPTSIAGGSTTTGRVYLDGRAASNKTVLIEILGVATNSGYSVGGSSSSNPLQGTTVIRSYKESSINTYGEFSITAGFEGSNVSRTIRATVLDSSGNRTTDTVTGTLLVTAQPIANVAIVPSTVESGGSAVVTVNLSGPAPTGGVVISVTSSNQALFPVNGTLRIPAGRNSTTFTVKAGPNTTLSAATVTVTAYRGSASNGSAKSGTVTINPLTYTVSTDPTAVFGGDTATGTITLPRPQSTALTFTLSAPSGSGVTLSPSTVTIPAGSLTGTFTITTTELSTTTNVPITIRVGTQTRTTVLTVRAVQVSSITLNPSTVRSAGTTTLTVQLDGAVRRATTVNLTYSNESLVSPVVRTVVIPAGGRSASVTLRTTRVARTLTTTISASIAGANAATTTLTVKP